MVEQHLEKFLRVYEERFVKVHGPLCPVVERVLRAFLTCGLVEWPNGCAKRYSSPFLTATSS